MFGLGFGEIGLILLILVLLFGAKKLPQLGKGMGEAVREFKKIRTEITPDSNKTERKS